MLTCNVPEWLKKKDISLKTSACADPLFPTLLYTSEEHRI